MGYSSKEYQVRADIFKESGKWYQTVELDMGGVRWGTSPVEAVKVAFRYEYENQYKGMWIVVLDPYADAPFPVMFKNE